MLDFINKPGVEDAYSFRDVSSRSDYKDAFFKESCNFSLIGGLVISVVL